MIVSEVSRRYAKALYDQTLSGGQSEKVLQELRSLTKAIADNKEISDFVGSPLVPNDQKVKAFQALSTQMSPDLVNFLNLLAEKSRLNLIGEMTAAFEAMIDHTQGVSRGVVRAAAPISEEQRKKLEAVVSEVTRKRVILQFQEDPQVLGGMVAQVGGWTFDDSLASHLRRLNEDLNRRTH